MPDLCNRYNKKPLVSIVTPVLNGEKFIEETIISVVSQSYENIEYIIIDGGSTDKTIEIIKKYDDKISYWVSEPDLGMYDAINRGFSIAKGDILAWLNSDDIYFPNTIERVVNVFTNNQCVDWITGQILYVDKNGTFLGASTPLHYFKPLIKRGLYRGGYLGSIQQESTFWRKSLWISSGGLERELAYAGDYNLWTQFAKNANLFFVPTVLAGFRFHEEQKTNNLDKYYLECDSCMNIDYKPLWRMFCPCIKLLGALIALYDLSKNTSVWGRLELLI